VPGTIRTVRAPRELSGLYLARYGSDCSAAKLSDVVNLAVLSAVAVAGAFGATSRYLLTVWLKSLCGESPWPIAIVNIVGCFGFGVCWSLCQGRMSQPIAIAVLAGFFGAFTTFSAFALDGQLLLAERKLGLFAANLIVQNGVGVVALWLGMLASGTRS